MTAIESATTPAHVPQRLVHKYDLLRDPQMLKDPHERVIDLQQRFPEGVFWTPCNGGHWVLVGHDVLADAARNTAVFSSRELSIPSTGDSNVLVPIMLDPPEHGKYRAVINKAISPRVVRELENSIREFANQLIDEVANQGRCEFVSSVAEPLPLTIFMKLLGLPLERLNEFRDWAVTAISSPDAHARQQNLAKIVAFMSEVIVARQQTPQDDLISALAQIEIDGRAITFEELQGYGILLFIAGLDTVVNGMCYTFRHLAQFPELQQQVREQPDLATAIVEEVMRRYGFVNPGRIITQDVEFHGVQMKEGERILLILGAGGLDPNVYEAPLEFRLDRRGARHLAFNTGPHACVGAALARVEIAALIQQWCDRIPDFRLDEDKPKPTFTGGPVFTMNHLHLSW